MTPDESPPDPLPAMFTSDVLGTPHGMFNRTNGISSSPFASLNLSYNVGDSPDNVLRNRQRIKQQLGIDILVSARQEHGDNIYNIYDITADTEITGYDGLITDQPGVGLLIQQADCQAVLLHDPVQKAVAAIHCGWRGSVLNIINKTMLRMMDEYQTDPSSVHAVISPSLGPCCAEFINYRQELPAEFHAIQPKTDYFDFWKISFTQLYTSGVPAEHIEVMQRCTSCNNDFFSYRRSSRKGTRTTGRQGSVILLKS